MIAQDYARGMPGFILSLQNVELVDHFLLGCGDLFNRTACHVLYVQKPRQGQETTEAFHYACPACMARLHALQNYLRCDRCHKIYFTFEGIPLLDEKYAVYITDLHRQHSAEYSSLSGDASPGHRKRETL